MTSETAELGRGRFRFLGFAEPPAATLLDRFDYRPSGAPPLHALEAILFLPGRRCLYDAQGRRVDVSRPTYIEPGAPAWFNPEKVAEVERVSMPELIEVPDRLDKIADPVLFVGEVHDHWGHFITDTLARLWALADVDPATKVLFAPDAGARLAVPLVRALLAAAGVGEDRILRPQGPTLFERLLCPAPALQLSRIYQGFDDVHRRIAAALFAASRASRRWSNGWNARVIWWSAPSSWGWPSRWRCSTARRQWWGRSVRPCTRCCSARPKRASGRPPCSPRRSRRAS